MSDGWIKLHRKTLENPVACKDADYLAVWIYLLLKATHDEIPANFRGHKIVLKPGQLITGRMKIASDLSVNESKVKRILSAFKNDQQIDQQTSNKNSLITILNWNMYQKNDQQGGQQMTSKRPADDQQVTTNKKERTKECKKENIYSPGFAEFWRVYPRKVEKGNCYKKYQARLRDGFSEAQLFEAAEKYAAECKRNRTEQKYIKHGSTFLSDALPFADFLKGGITDGNRTEPDPEPDPNDLVSQAIAAGVTGGEFEGF